MAYWFEETELDLFEANRGNSGRSSVVDWNTQIKLEPVLKKHRVEAITIDGYAKKLTFGQ